MHFSLITTSYHLNHITHADSLIAPVTCYKLIANVTTSHKNAAYSTKQHDDEQ